jgi:hypothetical protein
MAEYPSKEHWHNYDGTLLDNFLRIDAMIGEIIFYGFADHILHLVREKKRLFGATVEEQQELRRATRFKNQACIL